MSLLVPCDLCGSRERGRNAWLAWAWNRADHTRVAYKQRLCVTCFLAKVWPLLTTDADALFVCPVCHTDPSEDLDPIYLTYITPGTQAQSAELATCGPCAVKVRISAETGSLQLADRSPGLGAGATAPNTTPTLDAWAAIGLRL